LSFPEHANAKNAAGIIISFLNIEKPPEMTTAQCDGAPYKSRGYATYGRGVKPL
jgi:hypothetical protein